MKHIAITGPCTSSAQIEARRIYSEHALAGHHTVLVGITDHDNSLPERRMSSCDVLITVRHDGGPLTISEQ